MRHLRLVVAVLVSAALVPSTSAADGGAFTHVLCADPDTGRGVVEADGRLPDGTTNPHNVQFAGVSEPLSRCSGTMDGSRGVPVTTGAAWRTREANRGAALRYRAPDDLGFGGGVIYRHGSMSGRFGWTLTRNGRWDYIFGTPADERCTWGDGCFSRGTSSAPWSELNRVRIARATTDVNGFDLSVLCDIPDSTWECEADGSQTVRVYGGRLVLEDRSAPVPEAVSGSLATDATLHGEEEVAFSATDAGGGLYRVRLLVDGAERLSRLVHDNGGRCADVDPSDGDPYEFAWQHPCRASASVSATFDTRALPEGDVDLTVLVEDAGGNAATIVSRRARIDNVPDGAGEGPGAGGPGGPGGPGGAGGPGGPGGDAAGASAGAVASSSSLPPGAANGEGASPRARLTVRFARRGATARSVRFGRPARILGRLTDEHGRPIRNAIVDVSAAPARPGAVAVAAAPAITGGDGSFTYRAGGRSPSRSLRFAYRWLGGGEIVSAASLLLRVRAAVRLAVRLRGVVVRYRGRVLASPLPRAGKLVVLQGRVRGGRWQTFASRRAGRRGRFRGGYRLKVRRPGVRLEFRARALAESGWPYGEATSRVVGRRVR